MLILRHFLIILLNPANLPAGRQVVVLFIAFQNNRDRGDPQVLFCHQGQSQLRH